MGKIGLECDGSQVCRVGKNGLGAGEVGVGNG